MAALLHIRTHLEVDACECGSFATLKEVLEALCSKCGLTVREARMLLTSFERDSKLTLSDYATEVKS